MYAIEKGVSVPPRLKIGRPLKYPWPDMQPGDSISIPPSKSAAAKSAAYDWQRKHKGWQFVFRVDANGLRIWRAA